MEQTNPVTPIMETRLTKSQELSDELVRCLAIDELLNHLQNPDVPDDAKEMMLELLFDTVLMAPFIPEA